MILNVVIVLCLVSAFSLLIYAGLVMPKRFFKQTGNTMQFRCCKCKTAHTYSNEETVRLNYRPRNMVAITGNGTIKRKVSYRHFCNSCNEKTMQEPIGSPYNAEQLKRLRRKSFLVIGMIAALMIIGMAVGITLDTIA